MEDVLDIDPCLTLSNLPDLSLPNLPDPGSDNYQLDVALGTMTPKSLDLPMGIHISGLLRTDLYVNVRLSLE